MLALLIEYDGTNYAGWQNQPNARSVQSTIEDGIREIYGVTAQVVGSGRTDAGVHAFGQVAHVELPASAHNIPQDRIAAALNTRLPYDVRIRAGAYLQTPFHARYHAILREYRYTISPNKSVFTQRYSWTPDLPYQLDLLQSATSAFTGRHDFTTFSKHNESTTNYVCNVQLCDVALVNNHVEIRIAADRFVYGMCRSIVGAMMSVARKKTTVEQLIEAMEKRDRALQEVLAPPQGLTLHTVSYPFDIFV